MAHIYVSEPKTGQLHPNKLHPPFVNVQTICDNSREANPSDIPHGEPVGTVLLQHSTTKKIKKQEKKKHKTITEALPGNDSNPIEKQNRRKITIISNKMTPT